MASVVENIVKWECGFMTEDEEQVFFQDIIDSGVVWSLQEMYGRNATRLIDEGICVAKDKYMD